MGTQILFPERTLLLPLCASRQLSYLLTILVLRVGAAGSQDSMGGGLRSEGKNAGTWTCLYSPRHGAARHRAKSSEIPLGEADFIGQKALSVYCVASPLQKAGEVCQVRPGLEIPQAEETVPPNLLHTSPSLKYFLMLLSHLVGTLGLTGTHHLTMLFTELDKVPDQDHSGEGLAPSPKK